MRRAMSGALGALVLLAAASAQGKPAMAEGEQLDLNAATQSQLMRLPGVGETRADAILERRAKRPFGSVEELSQVRGFGRALMRKVRPHLAVRLAAPPRQAAQPARAAARPSPR